MKWKYFLMPELITLELFSGGNLVCLENTFKGAREKKYLFPVSMWTTQNNPPIEETPENLEK